MDLDFAESNQKLYICPGEIVPISHAVHLGRLARFYPACQDCPLNCDSGVSATPVADKLAEQSKRQAGELSLSHGSIRGVYLNRINRRVASDITGQFAQMLWDKVNRPVRTSRRERIEDWTAPLVVIGYDQRHSSPDIVTGIQDRFRIMGCDVIDVGLTIAPAIPVAIRHHNAGSGVFVTGCGHSPSWTGLDFFDATGQPCDVSNIVTPRVTDPAQKHARPVRWAGKHHFQPAIDLLAHQPREQLKLGRPIKIVVAAEDHVARDYLSRVLEPVSSDDVMMIELPKRLRDLTDPEDIDTRRVGEAVVAFGADLGFVVDEDVCRCAFVDNEGELLTSDEIARFLGEPTGYVAESDAGLSLVRLISRVSNRSISLADFVTDLT